MPLIPLGTRRPGNRVTSAAIIRYQTPAVKHLHLAVENETIHPTLIERYKCCVVVRPSNSISVIDKVYIEIEQRYHRKSKNL